MLLDAPPNSNAILSELGDALRRARKTLRYDNSDVFGKQIGVSGRTLRALEKTGKGSTDCLIRVLIAVCPEAVDELIQRINDVEPPFASVDEALDALTATSIPRHSVHKQPKNHKV